MVKLGAIRLGLAIANRLRNHEDRVELLDKLVAAVGDNGKVTPVEWAVLGKTLGVFDVRGTGGD